MYPDSSATNSAIRQNESVTSIAEGDELEGDSQDGDREEDRLCTLLTDYQATLKPHSRASRWLV
jgi:hypothetical protein